MIRKGKEKMKNTNTQYGFIWDNAEITRCCSDEKQG